MYTGTFEKVTANRVCGLIFRTRELKKTDRFVAAALMFLCFCARMNLQAPPEIEPAMELYLLAGGLVRIFAGVLNTASNRVSLAYCRSTSSDQVKDQKVKLPVLFSRVRKLSNAIEMQAGSGRSSIGPFTLAARESCTN